MTVEGQSASLSPSRGVHHSSVRVAIWKPSVTVRSGALVHDEEPGGG